MKKTLKILMAIILFAVVLTIATSVNAAVEPMTVQELIDTVGEEKAELSSDGKTLTIKADIDTTAADADADIKGKTLKISNIDVVLTGDYTGNVEMTGTVVTSGAKSIKGVVTVYGVLYQGNTVADTEYKVRDNGLVYSKAAIDTVDPTPEDKNEVVTFELKDKRVAAPSKTEYTMISVAKAATKSTVSVGFSKAYTTDETKPAATIESDKTYKSDVTVLYKNGSIKEEITNWTVAAATEANNPAYNANCADVTKADNVITIVTDKKLKSGDVVKVTVSVTGTDVKADYALTIGEVKVDEPDQNQPEQPENPADTNKPADDNKGDLDESPKTGDHIIPAATLLAVVVVANVVYFAKSKNN